jgi:acyl carrier protein
MTLTTLLSEILEIDPGEVTDELSRTTNPEWTSLRYLQLISALEEIGSISFTSREMAAVDSVAQLRALLAVKGIADGELDA